MEDLHIHDIGQASRVKDIKLSKPSNVQVNTIYINTYRGSENVQDSLKVVQSCSTIISHGLNMCLAEQLWHNQPREMKESLTKPVLIQMLSTDSKRTASPIGHSSNHW